MTTMRVTVHPCVKEDILFVSRGIIRFAPGTKIFTPSLGKIKGHVIGVLVLLHIRETLKLANYEIIAILLYKVVRFYSVPITRLRLNLVPLVVLGYFDLIFCLDGVRLYFLNPAPSP